MKRIFEDEVVKLRKVNKMSKLELVDRLCLRCGRMFKSPQINIRMCCGCRRGIGEDDL